MSDSLKHWDFREYFSINEIACLIEGVDPHELNGLNLPRKVIVERLTNDYIAARDALVTFARRSYGVPIKDNFSFPPDDKLMSRELFEVTEEYFYRDGKAAETLHESDASLPDRQTFSRETIDRWLRVNMLESKYCFVAKSALPSEFSAWKAISSLSLREAVFLILGINPKSKGLDPNVFAAVSALEHAICDAIHWYQMNVEFIKGQSEEELWIWLRSLPEEDRNKSFLTTFSCQDALDSEDAIYSELDPTEPDFDSCDEWEYIKGGDLNKWLLGHKIQSAFVFDSHAKIIVSPRSVVVGDTLATEDVQDGNAEFLSGKSRNYLLRLIGGMAMQGWKIPIHERLANLSELIDDLNQIGVSVNAETLRVRLKEAAQLIEDPQKSK